MNVYTLAARETVREIRESLSRQEPTVRVLKMELDGAMLHAFAKCHGDYESIELWARLAADLASMIQQKEKAL